MNEFADDDKNENENIVDDDKNENIVDNMIYPKNNKIIFIDKLTQKRNTIDFNILSLNLSKNKCSHHKLYNRRNLCTKKNYCSTVGTIIQNCLDNNIFIDKIIFDKYISFVFKCVFGRYECIESSAYNVQVINNIFKYRYIPKNGIIKIIVASYPQIYNSLKENSNFAKPNISTIIKIIKKHYYNTEGDLTIFNCVIDKQMIDEDDTLFDILFDLPNANIISFLFDYIKNNYYVKDRLTIDHFYKAIKFYPLCTKLINYFLDIGFKIDDECLKIVCINCNIDTINIILDYKILPQSKDFEEIIKSKTIKCKINPTFNFNKQNVKILSNGYSKDKITLLIDYGYIPTYDDIVASIINKVELPLSAYQHIIFNENINNLCLKYNYYPKYNFVYDDKIMFDLCKFSQTKSSKKLRHHIISNNIKPSTNNLISTINYGYPDNAKVLIEYGAEVDDVCIKRLMQLAFSDGYFPSTIYEWKFMKDYIVIDN
jgi:hypothetical protein